MRWGSLRAGTVAKAAAPILIAAAAAALVLIAPGAAFARASPVARQGGPGGPAGRLRWRPAFGISRSVFGQLALPQLALGADGQAIASASAAFNDPADSRALLFAGSPGGRITAPTPIPGVQQVLALAYLGRTLALLVGRSPRGLRCCSTVAVLLRRGRRVLSRQVLLGHLAGPALGALLAVHGRLVAAIASAQGVWDDRSARDGRFAPPRRLWGGARAPGALAAAAGASPVTALAFSAPGSPFGPPDEILTGSAGGGRAPARVRVRITAPSGWEIDELALAGAGGSSTLAWVQGGLDSSGAYRSQVYATRLAARGGARAVSAPTQLASGLSLAQDGAGAAVLAYRACTAAGACALEAALSPSPRLGFGPPQAIGAIDPTQVPAAAISRRGQALVGYVYAGEPFAVAASPRSQRFGVPHRLARTTDASQITLGFDPTGDAALAVWTQGVHSQALVGARLLG
jgi:hypothetical protein